MRRMEEYLAVAEQESVEPTPARFVRDQMTPARLFMPTETQSVLARVLQRLAFWYVKRQSRLSLYDLSPEQLADIGLSRTEAYRRDQKGVHIELDAFSLRTCFSMRICIEMRSPQHLSQRCSGLFAIEQAFVLNR